jgi:hypothetical protein
MRIFIFFLWALPVFCQPRLLLDARDFERIRKLAATHPWAATVLGELRRRADNWPSDHEREFGLSQWALPTAGAGWSHAYVCPDHGVRLKQDGGKNLCPIDGKDYHGWPIDNVVYMQRNDDNAGAARDLGLAFRLTGNPAYAEKARRIFSAYADLYLRLPIHDNDNRPNTKTGARVLSQTLSEAKWLVPLAFGYDLVRDSMPAAERERFETNVLRGAAAVIRRNDAGKSNWQSWHNAALLAAGLLTGDKELVTLAIDGPGGFRFQLRESITPDGPWYEGAWGYHFFALDPLFLTREMAERANLAVPEAPALKRMLDAPLECVFPDGSLPAFNDSGGSRLAGEARYYEIGYRLFHDPRYLAVLDGTTRGREALLWGEASLPAGRPPELSSAVLPVAGVATLRVRGSDHTVGIKFGPHGGGHGHNDKLTFVSYANGARQAADPGTQAYAAPSHSTWDKTTVAHNTIVVDEHTQEQSTGRLLDWFPLPDATAIRLSAGPVYPGIEMELTLVHTADYTLDVAEARATGSSTHRFDWLYHNFGKASCSLPLEPSAGLPHNNGYQHLTGTAAAHTSEAWQATFTQPEASLRLYMLGGPDTTVVLGQGLGPDLRVPVPFAMARRQGTSARFVALEEPYRSAPRVKSVREYGNGIFTVELEQATDEIRISPGEFTLVRRIAGKPADKPARLALAGRQRNELAEISNGAPLEVEWLANGAVEVYTKPEKGATLRFRAPQSGVTKVNGRQVESRVEGEFRVVRW